MALLRMNDKKLAANRANARLSHGPATRAGKEKVSGNACNHHLFAKKFPLHPAWEARIRAVVEPAAQAVPKPVAKVAKVATRKPAAKRTTPRKTA